jgi:penicillin-binding protein 2
MAVFSKYFELKAQDANSPPQRSNQPYVLTLPPAPKLEDVTLTRGAAAGTPNAAQH